MRSDVPAPGRSSSRKRGHDNRNFGSGIARAGEPEQRDQDHRHGENLYESLVSREEMVRGEDLGSYYRIPADSRDLDRNKHFVDGETQNFPD